VQQPNAVSFRLLEKGRSSDIRNERPLIVEIEQITSVHCWTPALFIRPTWSIRVQEAQLL